MTILQAIILGVVQGVTEFLPISSSGHLILVPAVFGWNPNSLAFDVAIHLATLLAILVGMRREIGMVVKDFFSHPTESILLKIGGATIPVVLVGLLLSHDFLDRIRTVPLVAGSLILWGIVLWGADSFAKGDKHAMRDVRRMRWWQALAVGCLQIFSLIPGSSRSGVTISAGLFSGLDRPTAARFSFLLAIPAIAGAGLLTGLDVAQTGLDVPMPALVAGFLSAFISGTLVIQWLLRIIARVSYRCFAVYRIALGLILLIMLNLSWI